VGSNPTDTICAREEDTVAVAVRCADAGVLLGPSFAHQVMDARMERFMLQSARMDSFDASDGLAGAPQFVRVPSSNRSISGSYTRCIRSRGHADRDRVVMYRGERATSALALSARQQRRHAMQTRE